MRIGNRKKDLDFMILISEFPILVKSRSLEFGLCWKTLKRDALCGCYFFVDRMEQYSDE